MSRSREEMEGLAVQPSVEQTSDQAPNSSSELPFENFPTELAGISTSFLGLDSIDSTNFSPTQHLVRGAGFFQTDLPVAVLAQHTVDASYLKVKAMLDKALAASKNKEDPELLRQLLLSTATVTDCSGRIHYQRTGYQLALGAKHRNVIVVVDGKRIQVVDGLKELYEEYFAYLPDGHKRAQEQNNQQFPEGFEAKEEARSEKDLAELDRALAALTAADDTICQQVLALDSFHGYDLRELDKYHPNSEILAGAIYLASNGESLIYKVRGLDGQIKEGQIRWGDLPIQFPESSDPFPRTVKDLLAIKYRCLPFILEKISAAEHIYTAAERARLSALSEELVKFTPKESATEGMDLRLEEKKGEEEEEKENTKEETKKTRSFKGIFEELKATMLEVLARKEMEADREVFTLLEALYRFRNHLEPRGHYTSGYHANDKLQLKVRELYDGKYEGFGNKWSAPKNVFNFQKLFGLVERLLPSCDAQVVAQGLYAVVKLGAKSRNSFAFSYGGGSIYPLDADLIFRLGYNYAVGDAAWRASVGPWRMAAHGSPGQQRLLENLYGAKTTENRRLLATRDHQNRGAGVQ